MRCPRSPEMLFSAAMTAVHPWFVRTFVCGGLVLAMSLVVPSRAEAQPQWYDGGIQYSTITNCGSIIQGYPYQEYGAGTFVGFNANPTATQPSPNTTYYIHVYVAGLGNACSGQRFYVDVALPPSTSLAITGGTPMYCLANGVP